MYEVEIKRLDMLDAELDVLWSHVPRYAYVGLLAPVVWYYQGLGWAFVELIVTASLVGTQSYLVKMRKSENRWNRAMLVEDVARIRAEVAANPQSAQSA
ncbi:MAG: hypothetical protein JWN04_4287 [Myxococcaceae bacterium]|nr:hypothetical protein [Myxococcaceae bacterium]